MDTAPSFPNSWGTKATSVYSVVKLDLVGILSLGIPRSVEAFLVTVGAETWWRAS
jgi:hypothetical protein